MDVEVSQALPVMLNNVGNEANHFISLKDYYTATVPQPTVCESIIDLTDITQAPICDSGIDLTAHVPQSNICETIVDLTDHDPQPNICEIIVDLTDHDQATMPNTFVIDLTDETVDLPCQGNGADYSQLDKCRDIIKNIVICDQVQQKSLIFSKLATCLDQTSEKTFNQILAEYKSEILPLIVEEYNDLTCTKKTIMSLVNELFCGLNLIDGFDQQAKTTLLLWENMILGDEKTDTRRIGKTDIEAGTVNLIRNVCDAVKEQCKVDGEYLEFRTFLTSRGEFDDVPISLNSQKRIDSLFHIGAGVYSIFEDMVEFTSGCIDQSGLLAEVSADFNVLPFKAGCRALGLISKQIIDPIWKALTSKGNVLEMDLRYKILLTKLKDWQEDARDIVGGTASLFDDIEVPKDLVFCRLTTWTDTDFFEMTVQIVELLLKSFLKVCSKVLTFELGSSDLTNRMESGKASKMTSPIKPHSEKKALKNLCPARKSHTVAQHNYMPDESMDKSAIDVMDLTEPDIEEKFTRSNTKNSLDKQTCNIKSLETAKEKAVSRLIPVKEAMGLVISPGQTATVMRQSRLTKPDRSIQIVIGENVKPGLRLKVERPTHQSTVQNKAHKKQKTSVHQKAKPYEQHASTCFSTTQKAGDGRMESYLNEEMKRYGGLWKKEKDVDEKLASLLDDEDRYAAVVSQLLFRRFVLGAKNERGVFNTSVSGRILDLEELVLNLKSSISNKRLMCSEESQFDVQ
ncbi:hypothetical protein UPYG_G00080460 [Umbra pygmaea]|uniref:Uncharacterized protein n=1 Tax=Umbra pygmaea TaxID=75934 RepID=A0ABD0XY36_UMBPY